MKKHFTIYNICGNKIARYTFGLMKLAQSIHESINGSRDILYPTEAIIYYEFLKSRINDWKRSNIENEEYDDSIKNACKAVIKSYEKFALKTDIVWLNKQKSNFVTLKTNAFDKDIDINIKINYVNYLIFLYIKNSI